MTAPRYWVLIGVAVFAVLATAGLRAQPTAAPPPAQPVGVLDYYTVERTAPQFAEATDAINRLEDEVAVLSRVAAMYTLLAPEPLARAVALERAVAGGLSKDQRGELEQLREDDDKANARYRALLQLPPAERTPQTDAEFDRLTKIRDTCRAETARLLGDRQAELDRKNQEFKESVTKDLDAAVAKVAVAKGLGTVVQETIRTVTPNLETGRPVVEYHRVVHYRSSAADVTKEVIDELQRVNAERKGLPKPE
jgi:Skp family chaperone for outer membrane proteins